MDELRDPIEEEIDAVIAEFDGDMRAAIRACRGKCCRWRWPTCCWPVIRRGSDGWRRRRADRGRHPGSQLAASQGLPARA